MFILAEMEKRKKERKKRVREWSLIRIWDEDLGEKDSSKPFSPRNYEASITRLVRVNVLSKLKSEAAENEEKG